MAATRSATIFSGSSTARRRTPLAKRLPQAEVQAGDPHDLEQQHSTGLGHQALAAMRHQDPGMGSGKIHGKVPWARGGMDRRQAQFSPQAKGTFSCQSLSPGVFTAKPEVSRPAGTNAGTRLVLHLPTR